MPDRKSSDYDPRILKLFDGYVHGRLTRRDFIDQAKAFLVAGVAAGAVLESLLPQYAMAEQVKADDPRLAAEWVTWPSPNGHAVTKGYLVRPKDAKGKLPGVLVVHENRGLNPHIADIARRMALEGFIVLAPDVLAALGGYPGTDEKGREMQASMDEAKKYADFETAARFLKAHAGCDGHIGAVGFCWGGGIVNDLATRLGKDLDAAAPFYGRAAKLEEIPNIVTPLMLHFAEHDDWVNKTWPAYEAALKADGKRYTAHTYDGVQHGFNNDSTPRYDKAAADLAWSRTVAFFKAEVK